MPPCCLPYLPAASHTSLLPIIPPCFLLYVPAASYSSPLPPIPPCCLPYLPAAPFTSLRPPIPFCFLLYLPAASYTSPLPPIPLCCLCIPLLTHIFVFLYSLLNFYLLHLKKYALPFAIPCITNSFNYWHSICSSH